MSTAFDAFRYLVFENANWDPATFNASTDIERALRADRNDVLNSSSTDLKAFFDRGGKLLMYHGWNDAALPAEGTIQYFENVRETMGADEVDQFARLFMVPAMGHCFGGPGPNAFDSLAVLDAWVESGSAPDRIVASKYANDLAPLLNMPTGPALSTRPLCAYPAVARWKGDGSTNDEANFVCIVPPKADI